MKKRIICLLVCAFMLASNTVFAIPYDEYISTRTEYKSTQFTLSPGLTYTETLTQNEKYGTERSYIYEFTPGMGTEIVGMYGEYLYGTDSLGELTASFEEQGNRVVGGVNGDFYTLATGVPLGVMIVDGELITSDDDRIALGFDSDGKAFISYPDIVTTLSGNKTELIVDHINKVPHEYALNLLSDKFAKTTKTQSLSTEIVLMPYNEVIYHEDEDFLPEHEDSFIVLKSDIEALISMLEEAEEQESEKSETKAEPLQGEDLFAEQETMGEVVAVESEEHKENDNSNINDEQETSEPEPEYFAKEYVFSRDKLTLGSNIKLVVKEIREESKNSEIPEGHFVLCAEKVYQKYRVEDISLYDSLELEITANEQWYSAVNAIGASGGLILQDGEYCDDVEIDHYPAAHPRTAVGVTEDGRVIFYCVDGRRTGHSVGLRIDQLSHEMKELGCVTAVNFDGGGSTTVYASLPGEFFSTLHNVPSVSPERKTANSLLFVNKTESLSDQSEYYMYPTNVYVYKDGSELVLPKTLLSGDINYHPISVADDFVFEYGITENNDFEESAEEIVTSQIVDNSIFVSGNKLGKTEITASFTVDDETVTKTVGYVTVTDKITDFETDKDEYIILPFGSAKLELSAQYGPAQVLISPTSVMWDISGEINDENIVDTDVTLLEYDTIKRDEFIESDKAMLMSDGEFIPKTFGESYYITLMVADQYKTVRIQIEDFPFSDSLEHWSAKNIAEIYDMSLMQGELENDKLAFRPDRNLTKAEFLTVLARMLMPDKFDDMVELNSQLDVNEQSKDGSLEEQTQEQPQDETADNSDETVIDLEVVELYENEESVTTDTTKAIDENITEHQQEDLSVQEDAEQEKVVLDFADEAEIPEWSRQYFEALYDTGLLDLVCAYDEGGNKYIEANKNISRVEVMTILGALCEPAQEDFVSMYTDSQPLEEHTNYELINNAVALGIFEGYEDGSLRAERELTRAEAATVILRYYKIPLPV